MCAILTLPVGWLLIKLLGIHGAVLGMILTSLVVNLFFWWAYRRDLRSPAHRGGADVLAAPRRPAEVSPSAAGDTIQVAAEPTGTGALLVRLLEALDREGIRYCLLHGYEEFPQRVASDVDCVVSAEHLPDRLASLLRDYRRQLDVGVVQWLRDDAHFIVLAQRTAGAGLGFLQLHAGDRYDLCRRTLYRADEILETRRRFKQFWVPAAGVEFACFVARRIVKGNLDNEQQRRLNELYRQDPDGCQRELARFWGTASSGLMIAAAKSADWSQVTPRLGRLRAELRRRAALRRPLNLASNVLAGIGRRLRRLLRRDRGLSVVFLGTDGSGKSSVVSAIRQQWSPAFCGTARHTFPPALRQRGGSETNSTPHAAAPRSWAASVTRAIAYWFVYYTVGFYFATRRTLARQTLILYDRHLVDALVDARRYRYAGPQWLLRLIWRLIPKPDLVVLLDAPAEVVRARKQEVSQEEIARQRDAYRALVAALPNGHVVDAARPLERVIADAGDIVLNHLAARAARQLCLEVQP
jgi:thymidylate kinase